MKKFFKKIKSYSFWVALASAAVVLLNALGRALGFSIENKVVEDVILGISGVLAVLGIVNMNGQKDGTSAEQPVQEKDEKETKKEEENLEDGADK